MASVFKKDNQKIVPWFSMLEWREVYKQIYSNDTVAQRSGYEKILVWKARCATLPAGVECTLSLIHVSLQDKEIWPQIVEGQLPLYREHDLRLMYSTSIMRFLNHIAMVAQDQFETMYKMAKRVHIPDWLVNIRHDLAHGYNLPSLNVLRAATHFTLGWIHEHYWKGEAEMTLDYFATEVTRDNDKLKEHFQDYIETWQALKLYSLHGYKYIKNIPDSHIMSLVQEVIGRLPKKMKKKVTAIDGDADLSKKNIDDLEVTALSGQILKHLEIFIMKNKATLIKDDLLVTTLLEGGTFLPDEELLKTITTEIDVNDNEALPPRLRQLWQTIFSLFQDADVLPSLIKKLIELTNKKEENTHRRKVAAMWLKEICLGIAKAKRIGAYTQKFKKQIKLDANRRKHTRKKNNAVVTSVKSQIIEHVEKTYPELQGILLLRIQDLHNTHNLLKLVLDSPNHWTFIFLPSFLEIVEPALQSTMKKNILDLVNTFTCADIEPAHTSTEDKSQEVEIFTLEMLTNNSQVDQELQTSEMEIDEPQITVQEVEVAGPIEQQTNWMESESYLEWENCPLGILPWQKSETMGSANLMCDTVWKPTLSAGNRRIIDPVFPVHSHDTIDWDEVKANRKRHKKYRQRVSILKKACKLTLG